MRRIVVVGGGISGLVVAYRLERRLPGAEVLVLEQQSRLGGVIDTRLTDGFLVEAGPNGFPDNNPSTLELAREVGLQEQLVAGSESAGRNRFVLVDGRLRMLPASVGAFLRSNLLSWTAKAELLMEGIRPPRKRFTDESIDSFARRRVGREASNTLVDAFITGILAGDPRLLSIQAAFPRLAGYEREFGSVTAGMKRAAFQRRVLEAEQRGEAPPALPSFRGWLGGLFRGNPQPRRAGKIWSFQGGLQTLVDGIRAQLKQPAVTGVAVRRIRRAGQGYVVEGDGKDKWQADAVVLSCPADQQAAVLADLDGELAERIGGIPYNRVAVVALGYRQIQVPHSLDGFGYLSPQRTRRDVLGVQWCSSIYPNRAPEGMVLVRAMCGGWHRGEMVDWTDERLLAAVRAELAQTLGVRTAPVFHHLVRWRRAIPQYLVGHLERVAWIGQRLRNHPGLFVGGNAYRGVAINDCVEQAGLLATRVAEWMTK